MSAPSRGVSTEACAGVAPAAGLAERASDEDLAARAAAGDRASFDALVERFARPLLAFVMVRVGDRHDAEEVVQESFLRAWGAIGRYDARRRFSTWLYTIARNEAVSIVRSRARREGGAARGVATDAPAPVTARADQGVWSVAAAVLGSDEYECVWLRYAEGRTPREIGVITGRSGVGVRVLLHRARARLREALGREGV